jgi:hypothetical protein
VRDAAGQKGAEEPRELGRPAPQERARAEVASRRSAAAAQECVPVNNSFVCGKAASRVLIAQPIFLTGAAQARPSNHWNASISS